MDLTFLHDVLATPRRCGTVHVEARRDDGAGAREMRLRWQALAGRLREQGADEADIGAIEARVLAPTGLAGAASEVLAASGGQVVFEAVLHRSTADGEGTAGVAPLPDVLPVLRDRAERLPFLVVKADRAGADVEAHDASGLPANTEEQVDGARLHITKVGVGGWAHLRFQRTTENVWRDNARQVAEIVDAAADRHDARLVLLAGDVHARRLVSERLTTRATVVELAVDARAAGASGQRIDEAVHTEVARVLRDRREAVLDRLRARGGGETVDHAAADLGATVRALQQAQVDVLLLRADAVRHRSLRIGPGGTDIALPGAPQPWQGEGVDCRADLALVRAAVLTGADVELLPEGPEGTPPEVVGAVPDGAAALLRG